jgi:hypothetical protein
MGQQRTGADDVRWLETEIAEAWTPEMANRSREMNRVAFADLGARLASVLRARYGFIPAVVSTEGES